MTGPRVIRRDAVIPVHEANALTGEVPCWDARNGRLWWADIQGQRLLGFSPASGRQETHNLPGMLGLIVLRAAGGLVLGLEDGLYPFDPATGLGRRLVAVEADDARTRLNDGAADASGRLWFGTMDKTGSGEPIGGLYCLADGVVRRVRSNVQHPQFDQYLARGPDLLLGRFAHAHPAGVRLRSGDRRARREPHLRPLSRG